MRYKIGDFYKGKEIVGISSSLYPDNGILHEFKLYFNKGKPKNIKGIICFFDPLIISDLSNY